jgi:hypothetical protein
MDYLMLSIGKNFYATVGIFLSRAKNVEKFHKNVGKFHSTQWKCSVSPFFRKMALNKLFNDCNS